MNIEQMVASSKKRVKVSVCIPTFNYGRFISNAIDSVILQTFQDFELIVVDNCSTDNTKEIVERYVTFDRRIKFFSNNANFGMVENWNRCLHYATGEYVKILCADDLLAPICLEKSVSVLDNYPDVAIVTSARKIATESLEPIDVLSHFNKFEIRSGVEIIRRCLVSDVKNIVGEPTAVLFRNKDAKRGFDTRYKQIVDLEMWLHLLERGAFAYIPEELCLIRQHESQATQESIRNPSYMQNDVNLIRKAYMTKPHLFNNYFLLVSIAIRLFNKLHRRVFGK